jgi:OOP family OmpA-OmpF porin
MKKLLFGLFLAGSLFGGTYDYEYSVLDKNISERKGEKLDFFMYGDFIEIVRFNKLDFSNGIISDDSYEYLKDILKTVETYIKDEKNIHIKIIGHSDETTDDKNEKKVDSKTYANKIQNIFRYSLNNEEALENSSSYASEIAKAFEDNNISKDITTVEYRAGKDMGFSNGTDEGRDLSNRVMVTMYVMKPKDKDSDEDGVFDSKDECPDTPKGVDVDEKGCPLDSDKDAVFDYIDECPDTPTGVSVDEKGCPFDTDKDGVLDYNDECPDTMSGLNVNEVGCPVSMDLRLNFETDSYEISEDGLSKVLDFAEFLKNNLPYNVEIIGHTDSVGEEQYNTILSQNRANSVKDALVNNGVDENRFSTKGVGELEPIETNKTAVGRASNRRIEVKLLN